MGKPVQVVISVKKMFVSEACSTILFSILTILYTATAVVQSIKTFASHAVGLVFYSRLDKHKFLKHVCSNSSTATRSPTGVSVSGPLIFYMNG